VWPHDVESFQGSTFCLFVMVQPWNIGVCWIDQVVVTELTVVIFFLFMQPFWVFICIPVLENRIICCQIFCDLLLKSAFERIFNVMQLILVKIKWKYLIQKFHDICLSYYFQQMFQLGGCLVPVCTTRIIAKKNWFTRHETDRFLNNHC
jgi:hypothetical protein